MKKYILAGLAGILFTARSVHTMDFAKLAVAHATNTVLSAGVMAFSACLREQELNVDHRRAIDALRAQLDQEHAQAIRVILELLDHENEQELARSAQALNGRQERPDVVPDLGVVKASPEVNGTLHEQAIADLTARLATQRAARVAMQHRFANLIEDMENRLIENFKARVRADYLQERRRDCLAQLDRIITEVCQNPGLRAGDKNWVRQQYRQAVSVAYVVRSETLFQAVQAFFIAMINDGVRGQRLDKEVGDRLSNAVFGQTHRLALGQREEGGGDVFKQAVSERVNTAEETCVQLEVWKQLNVRVAELRESGVAQDKCARLARLEEQHSEERKAQFAREFAAAIAAIDYHHGLPAVG